MRQVDFSPLYRSTVGFDSLFNMFDDLTQPEGLQSYPPYNIERLGENSYRISMAVAGFEENELDISAFRNQLTIKGEKDERNRENDVEFLYRGIASRSFERRFQLADYIEVAGAHLKNGLLYIELVRHIPDEMKPRKINVKTWGADESGKKANTQPTLEIKSNEK